MIQLEGYFQPSRDCRSSFSFIVFINRIKFSSIASVIQHTREARSSLGRLIASLKSIQSMSRGTQKSHTSLYNINHRVANNYQR